MRWSVRLSRTGAATPRPLFDHLVGGRQQRHWDGDAERLGGLQVDGQLELDWVLHWQVGRLVPFEDAADILTYLTIRPREARPIAHQTAGLDIFSPGIGRRQRVAGCERDNLSASGVKERIGGNEERLDSLLRGLDERRPEIA